VAHAARLSVRCIATDSWSARDWIYWPRGPEHAVPWLLLALLAPVLGTARVPSFSPSAMLMPGGVLQTLALAVLLLLLDLVLLWSHLRIAFLTWGTGRRAMTGTFMILVIIYQGIWGIAAVLRGEVHLDLLSPDWLLTVRQLTVGFWGLALALLLTHWSKTGETDLGKIKTARDMVLHLMHALEQSTVVSPETIRATLHSLDTVAEAWQKSDVLPIRPRDRCLLTIWSRSAKAVRATMNGAVPADVHGKLEAALEHRNLLVLNDVPSGTCTCNRLPS
jgi:hypothetical protein